MNAEHKELMDRVSESGEYNDEIEGAFKEALEQIYVNPNLVETKWLTAKK